MKLSLEEYKIKFYSLFPDSTLQILEILPKHYILVKDNFGFCKVYAYNLLKGHIPTINSAIDKLEYYKNQYINKYPDSTIEIIKLIGAKDVLIKSRYGSHVVQRNNILFGQIPTIESAKNKNEYFVNQANEIHNFKYNYDNINYTTTHCKISIYCNEHERIFLQTPAAHLQGSGCPLCRNEFNSIYNGENSTGWSCTNWEIRSKLSKNFDSFKVYIIECWNEKERFFKIGRTFQPILKRFNTSLLMPYDFKIIKTISGESREVFELEQKLKNINKKNKYIPLIRFHGFKECYFKIENERTI